MLWLSILDRTRFWGIGILLHLNLCSAEALTRLPGGTNNRPPCTSKLCGPVLCRSEFCEEEWEEGGLGWLHIAAHSLNRMLRPPGLGLPCIGSYKAYLEDMSRALICLLVFGTRDEALTLAFGILCQKYERRSVYELKKVVKCFFRLRRRLEIRCCCCCSAIITQLFVKPCFYSFIYTM